MVALTPTEAASLETVYAASAGFFDRQMRDKARHGTGMFGYRGVESGYSQTPERPDRHEAFLLWSASADGIPEPGGVSEITSSMLRWREVAADIVRHTLAELAAHFGAYSDLAFTSTSYVQVNHYAPRTAEREFLQDVHEDGHLLTILSANAPGLEILDEDGASHPVQPGPARALVMPGSLLTTMSGGRIAPLLHQVKNLGLPSPTSVLYFVNPQLDVELKPWVVNDTNADLDVRELARTNPNAFGLPELPQP